MIGQVKEGGGAYVSYAVMGYADSDITTSNHITLPNCKQGH
jgi:hypothetical protein